MTYRKSVGSLLLARLFLPACLILIPGRVWAVQQHSGAEGLVTHQLGHILFIAGMLLVLHRLRVTAAAGRGWTFFRCFLWLIIFWNILTFYGHLHRELIDPANYISSGGRISGFILQTPLDVLFYLSRLDHLLLIPAFFFLLLALVQWRKQS